MSDCSAPSVSPAHPPGWAWHALGCMTLAAVAFLLGYGICRDITAMRSEVWKFHFAWERQIPFVREMIVPYMSLNLLFCGAFFLLRDREARWLHTRRILLVVGVSCGIFLLLPMQFGWARPVPAGWTAPLFHLLYAADGPWNLAPSLHISQCWLIGRVYCVRGPVLYRRLVCGWFFLIGLSTLLVWQHHVLDVVTGLLLGMAIERWTGKSPVASPPDAP